ncbi:MAG: hypothetical protein AAF108_09305 [Planctomycetota bacterium]
MLLFAFYAVGIWYAIYRKRRTLAGVAWLVGGTLALVGVGWFHYKLQDWTTYDIYLPVMQVLLYPYTALVLGVGGFFVTLPGPGCRVCGYDIPSADQGVCPECGATAEERSTKRGRRQARRRRAAESLRDPEPAQGIRLAAKEQHQPAERQHA